MSLKNKKQKLAKKKDLISDKPNNSNFKAQKLKLC
jgi:hypothetical protein